MSLIEQLAKDVWLPPMIKVKQNFQNKSIASEDIPSVIWQKLQREEIASQIGENSTIAIACGSRGISNIDIIIKAMVDFVKSKGAIPYIVAAMGSHGGATQEGQLGVLSTLGITPDTMGCPIDTSMETIVISKTKNGGEVHLSAAAARADGILLCNRIKPHTSFRGKYESGLMKMLAIGLAKQAGAEQCHNDGFQRMAENVEMFGRAVLERANIIAGIGIIESSLEQTAELYSLLPNEIIENEPLLLEKSKQLMPKIFLDDLDVLILDETGKNISGDGMDPNITGTFGTSGMTGGVNVQRVVVLDLTEKSHGSAVGIGMAHAITRRFYEKIKFETTYPNLITTKVMEQGRIPMVFENDKQAIQIALRCCIGYDLNKPRIVRIKNTLSLEEIYISEGLLEDAKSSENMQIMEDAKAFNFDQNGNLF